MATPGYPHRTQDNPPPAILTNYCASLGDGERDGEGEGDRERTKDEGAEDGDGDDDGENPGPSYVLITFSFVNFEFS